MNRSFRVLLVSLSLACGGPSKVSTSVAPAPTVDASPELAAIVAAPDRSADDRALDAGRHPAELLTFIGVKPGMRVADLAAGGGYTSELLARAVGPAGAVFSQNNKFVLQFANEGWTARLASPAMKNATRVERELEDPLPPEAKDLDAIVMVLFYHDAYWQKTDRARMNASILAALKPGGVFVVVDHQAAAGAGATQVQTLHRIESSEVVADVTKAGFTLAGEGAFLRNPGDAHDWNASPRSAGERRGTSDRFVLRFKKP